MYNIFPTILQLTISDLTAKAFPPSKRFLFLAPKMKIVFSVNKILQHI